MAKFSINSKGLFNNTFLQSKNFGYPDGGGKTIEDASESPISVILDGDEGSEFVDLPGILESGGYLAIDVTIFEGVLTNLTIIWHLPGVVLI